MAGLSDWLSSLFPSAGGSIQGTSIPGDAGQAEAAAQQPSLTNWMQGNQQTLMGLGLGLMSGDSKQDAYRNAMLGAQRGVVLDASAKKDKEAQAERAKRQQAYQQLADKGMLPPEIANNPELADQYLQQKWQAQFRAPREKTLTEQIYEKASPEQQAAYRDQLMRGSQGNDALNQAAMVKQREADASRFGMTPDDPRYKSYVLTGKMPREDAQALSATDKKFIEEADGLAESADVTIGALRRAKDISPKAKEGFAAKQRGYVGSLMGQEAGSATVQLDNEVTANALSSMKAIFGANPTEGERQILLDIQGSVNLPDADRQKIYDRAITAMERRRNFYKNRAEELRGGTFYKPGGGSPSNQQPPDNLSAADAIVGIR